MLQQKIKATFKTKFSEHPKFNFACASELQHLQRFHRHENMPRLRKFIQGQRVFEMFYSNLQLFRPANAST